jgi:hypothetical protein
MKEGQAQDWGINFFRVRRSSNELSVWSPHPRSMSPLRMGLCWEISGDNSTTAHSYQYSLYSVYVAGFE